MKHGNYRNDIAGLRSVAVLPVILFHAGLPYFDGGFIGVDIFFVISGFLITGIISKALDEGRFNLVGFYERRVRRIAPALIAMVLISGFAAFFILLPNDFKSFGESAIAAVFFVANMFFWLNTGYFDAPAASYPLLHTWSLAVEEQFYIVFPLLMLVLTRFAHAYRLVIVITLFLASLIWGAVLTSADANAAFYLAPSRAWELLLGALLALGAFPSSSRRWLNELLVAVGLAAIATSVLFFNDEMPWPGFAALLPCIGTALVLYGGINSQTFCGKIIGSQPFRYIGAISYSLYLWHWPILVFANYYSLEGAPSAEVLAGALILTAVLSVISYHIVEQPFRVRYFAGAPGRLFSTNAVAVALIAIIGGLAVATGGLPDRLPAESRMYADAMIQENYYPLYDRARCFLEYNQTNEDYPISECAPDDGATEILIIGDSYAANLYPGLKANFEGTDYRVFQYTGASCRPVIREARRCDMIVNAIPQIVQAIDPDYVVISGQWSLPIREQGEDLFSNRLGETIERAREAGATVIVAGQSPMYNVSPPMLGYLFPHLRTEHMVTRAPRGADREIRLIERIAEQNGVHFYDFLDVCVEGECPILIDGQPLHWDAGHMTLTGSLYYTAPLAEVIRNLDEARR